MSKPRITKKLVKIIRKQARESHSDELKALCDSWIELKRLSKYAQHKHDCNVMSLIPNSGQGCTCKLEKD